MIAHLVAGVATAITAVADSSTIVASAQKTLKTGSRYKDMEKLVSIPEMTAHLGPATLTHSQVMAKLPEWLSYGEILFQQVKRRVLFRVFLMVIVALFGLYAISSDSAERFFHEGRSFDILFDALVGFATCGVSFVSLFKGTLIDDRELEFLKNLNSLGEKFYAEIVIPRITDFNTQFSAEFHTTAGGSRKIEDAVEQVLNKMRTSHGAYKKGK